MRRTIYFMHGTILKFTPISSDEHFDLQARTLIGFRNVRKKLSIRKQMSPCLHIAHAMSTLCPPRAHAGVDRVWARCGLVPNNVQQKHMHSA